MAKRIRKKRSRRKGKSQVPPGTEPAVEGNPTPVDRQDGSSQDVSESTIAPSTVSLGTLSPNQSEDEWDELITPVNNDLEEFIGLSRKIHKPDEKVGQGSGVQQGGADPPFSAKVQDTPLQLILLNKDDLTSRADLHVEQEASSSSTHYCRPIEPSEPDLNPSLVTRLPDPKDELNTSIYDQPSPPLALPEDDLDRDIHTHDEPTPHDDDLNEPTPPLAAPEDDLDEPTPPLAVPEDDLDDEDPTYPVEDEELDLIPAFLRNGTREASSPEALEAAYEYAAADEILIDEYTTPSPAPTPDIDFIDTPDTVEVLGEYNDNRNTSNIGADGKPRAEPDIAGRNPLSELPSRETNPYIQLCNKSTTIEKQGLAKSFLASTSSKTKIAHHLLLEDFLRYDQTKLRDVETSFFEKLTKV